MQDTGGTSGSTDEDSFDEIFKAGLHQAKLVMNNNVGEVVGGRDTWDSSESDETSSQGTGFKTQVRGDSCSETQSTEDEESSTEEEAELGELAELLEALPLGFGQAGHHKHHRRQVTHAEHPEGSGLAQRRLRREEELGDEEGAGPEGGDGDGGGQRLRPHGEHLAKEHAEDGGAPWP